MLHCSVPIIAHKSIFVRGMTCMLHTAGCEVKYVAKYLLMSHEMGVCWTANIVSRCFNICDNLWFAVSFQQTHFANAAFAMKSFI